jgi:hypothetical protein
MYLQIILLHNWNGNKLYTKHKLIKFIFILLIFFIIMNFLIVRNFSIFRKKKKEILTYDKIDYKSIKIKIDDSNSDEDRQKMANDNNNIEEHNNTTINSAIDSSSKWNKEYTYPPDSNLLKFRLNGIIYWLYQFFKYFLGRDKIRWVRMPDQRV